MNKKANLYQKIYQYLNFRLFWIPQGGGEVSSPLRLGQVSERRAVFARKPALSMAEGSRNLNGGDRDPFPQYFGTGDYAQGDGWWGF
jgi:hypothetical protein